MFKNRHCTCMLYVPYLYRLTWWRHDIDSLSACVFLVRGFDQTSVDSPHKGPGTRSFDVSSYIAWRNCWKKNRDACETRYLDALWPSLYLWASILYNKYQHIWYQCNVEQVARHDLRSRSTIIFKFEKKKQNHVNLQTVGDTTYIVFEYTYVLTGVIQVTHIEYVR